MNLKTKPNNWLRMVYRLSILGCVSVIFILLTGASFSSAELSTNEAGECSCKEKYPATATLDVAFRHVSIGNSKSADFRSCWSCPLNYRRTLAGIRAKNACVAFTTATRVGTYGCKNKYGKQSFFDPRKGGECWTCPSGFKRTWDPVTAKRACSKGIFGPFSRATRKGKSGCDRGFGDMIHGGTCWTCPTGGKRTIFHVEGKKACEVTAEATLRGTRYSFDADCGEID